MATALFKDSVENLSNSSARSNSDRRGRLIKGTVNSNGSVPTIPTRYYTIVTENNEHRGFTRSSKRFQYNTTDTPGPGAYRLAVDTDKQLKKTSDSKNGYGGFASKASREMLKFNPGHTPGAGSYETHKIIVNKRKDFSVGPTSIFQKPIAHKLDKENDVPAPNSYDITKAKLTKTNNVTADSAFKSKSKRELISLEKVKDLPAPNTYNIKDDLLHESTKVPFSSFKTTANRNSFIPANNLPGPGEYRPEDPIIEPVNRQLFPRRHYLAISAPAIPMEPDMPLPGPGAYELRDFKEPEKKYMSSAVFVSSTGRWVTQVNPQISNPGPGQYSPAKYNKQSFHYNYDRKWV